jgi:hypothetical protein
LENLYGSTVSEKSRVNAHAAFIGCLGCCDIPDPFQGISPRNQKPPIRKRSIFHSHAVASFSQLHISFHQETVAKDPEALPLSWSCGKGLIKNRPNSSALSVTPQNRAGQART